MLIKKTTKKLLSNYSITTQILKQNSLWPWKLWVWDRPLESSGVKGIVSREWWRRRGGGGRGFSWKKDQCRLLMPTDLLLSLLWFCMSLYQQCCKAVLDGRIYVGQARQRVFGFLNGPLHFEVGALGRRMAENNLIVHNRISFTQSISILFYLRNLYVVKVQRCQRECQRLSKKLPEKKQL